MTVTMRYVLFAILSTVLNFAVQEAVVRTLPRDPLLPSIVAGTIAGFIFKYILDKNWIFFDSYTSHSTEARKVFLYALFSIFTTMIFWAFEMVSWMIWQTSAAKYTGGAFGLAVGYVCKYALDRRYVFNVEEV